MNNPLHCILPLSSPQATLPRVGGKGANLASLSQAGFTVPGGFLITVEAYQSFIQTNRLAGSILAMLPASQPEDPSTLEEISRSIREMFAAHSLPEDFRRALLDAYAQLGSPPVAVRSSATAEDLPELSFAGQQDTYLNVLGEQALVEAVVRCWASLWTARAIGYRLRNRIPQDQVALAVVVQKMVESQASGVVFTANPLTGLRIETVIDATLGLGEALVSGLVEPDHYVVDPKANRIVSKVLGAKALAIHSRAGGGTEKVERLSSDRQALPDDQILQLAQVSQQVADLYGFPQDIEWAWATDTLYLLQSRPITSLYPLPEGMPPEPLKVLLSFGAVQGMLDPITPLGRDMITQIFVSGAKMMGIPFTLERQTALFTAGERLWGNLSTPMRNTIGRRLVRAALVWGEPSIRQAVLQIWDVPRLQPGRKTISSRAALQLLRFLGPLAFNALLNLASPGSRRRQTVDLSEKALIVMGRRVAGIQGSPREQLGKLADLFVGTSEDFFPPLMIVFIAAVASGMASFNFLSILAKEIPPSLSPGVGEAWGDLVLEIMRALPNNPTTEMDLQLWNAAQTIRHDPQGLQSFRDHSSAELARLYQHSQLPPIVQQTVGYFLSVYGSRGFGEIDAGRPRWQEDPTHVFDAINSYLKIQNPDQAPDAVFARSAQQAALAIERVASTIRKTPHGWIKSRLVRLLASRARQLMSLREVPKFFLVRLMGILRRKLLDLGKEFAGAGEIGLPDDLVFLTFSELKAFSAGEGHAWREIIAQRRANYQREKLRRQVPRLLLSDGRAFYEGLNAPDASDHTLVGSPVSPGSAEGVARVVLDPSRAGMLPGEILVCPGTDPSWTPLFLTAAGLVMEVGGMMTHGAVVAREYGIPAVVGVDQATQRLHTGQRIRLDGSTGSIILLD